MPMLPCTEYNPLFGRFFAAVCYDNDGQRITDAYFLFPWLITVMLWLKTSGRYVGPTPHDCTNSLRSTTCAVIPLRPILLLDSLRSPALNLPCIYSQVVGRSNLSSTYWFIQFSSSFGLGPDNTRLREYDFSNVLKTPSLSKEHELTLIDRKPEGFSCHVQGHLK